MDWDPVYLGKVAMWSGAALEGPQILTYGAELIGEITAGNISVRTAIKGLRLSMSLRSMNPASARYLLIQPDRPLVAIENLLSYQELPPLDSFSDHSSSFTIAQQTVVGSQTATNAVDSDLSQKTSYAFLATYLMKLLIKDPANVHFGITNMKRRYNRFYGPSRIINQFSCTRVQLIAYRDALISQAHIMNSFTLAVAQTHQNLFTTMDQQEQGVLTYLCFLPFSYTDMHAYTMLIDIQGISKLPFNKLLTLFHFDVTAPALRKIADIIRNHERTVANPHRDVTFRYCALWGANYFHAVRSKNCTYLIYTLACALKRLKETSEEYADPEKIAAVDHKLSAAMKKTLSKIGVMIGDTIMKNMLQGIGASSAFAMALPEQNIQDVMDLDWEMVANAMVANAEPAPSIK